MAESATSRPASGGGARRASLIDQDSHFSGVYRTPHDLHIDGRYDGEIECLGTVFIGESAAVHARITAGNVTVAGRCEGEIACETRFEILTTGRVSGSVSSAICVVHEGAFYEGHLSMTGARAQTLGRREERAAPEPQPTLAFTPAPPPPAPPAAEEAPQSAPAAPELPAGPLVAEEPPAPAAPTPVSSPLRRRTSSEGREHANGGHGPAGVSLAAPPHRNGLTTSAEVG